MSLNAVGGTLLPLSIELQLALKVNRNESSHNKYVVHSNATLDNYLSIFLKVLKPDDFKIMEQVISLSFNRA